MEYINNFETFVNESASNDYLKAVKKCAETGFYYSNSDTGEKCGVSYENRWNLWNPNDCDENTFEKFIEKCKFKYQTNKEFITKGIAEDTIRPEDNEPYYNPYFMGVGIEPKINKNAQNNQNIDIRNYNNKDFVKACEEISGDRINSTRDYIDAIKHAIEQGWAFDNDDNRVGISKENMGELYDSDFCTPNEFYDIINKLEHKGLRWKYSTNKEFKRGYKEHFDN